MEVSIPTDIIKIQKKLIKFEKGSRNYKKYQKILVKHIKTFTMKRRSQSNIQTIRNIKEISGY
jgi:hypothetical protein